jgi:hypothetical protein
MVITVTAKPKYDVAISFLSKDEPTAAALHGRLSEGLEVFFYPRNQEELAGTDGLESMRKPFLEDSRIVAVLYREPWGKTPWTRVEQTAIQEGCLNHGWHRLFFIVLDETNALPIWLPQNHVRFNFADFGLEQAVGAIKARVQESGGVVTPLTALKRAAIYEQDVLYLEDRKQISTVEGMRVVRQKVLELFAEIERLCAEIVAKGNATIRVGSNAGLCVLTNDQVSLIVGFRQPYANTTDGCALKILEYNGRMALPGERVMFVMERTQLHEINFLPELSRAREYGWIEKDKPSQFLSSIALADKCVIQFLNLAGRADRGEIEHPSW